VIVGLGIDLVEISRIERAMRNPRFVERILTEKEREFCRSAAQVAGRWAAKEAIAKAVGLRLHWHHVEILPDDMGQPHATVNSPDYDLSRYRLNVSITHERTQAAAVAVLERVVIQVPVF